MNKKMSRAFTMLELIFVIVIMGIIGKFGVEFLAQAYNNFIHAKVNNDLQANSTSAVEFVANRLQYRIKDSVIARESNNTFFGLAGYDDETAPILEWVATDIEGFRGDTTPYWSGIIDLSAESNATLLTSPGTNTASINNLIITLSGGAGNSDFNDTALYFIDSTSDVRTGYGWDFSTGAFTDQTKSMHPINSGTNPDEFIPAAGTGNFSNVDVSEYYKLAWTAYAVGIDAGDYNETEKTGTLTLWYDYQPWNGDTYKTKADGTETKSQIIMENVSTFQFMAIGSLIKIQVCSNSDLLKDEGEEYSICKEKTIY